MFKKLLILDFNVIGIITDFVSNNFHFLYFLKQNEIKPYNKEICYDNVDWSDISSNIETYETFYNTDIINDFKENYDWDILTHIKIKNQDFLTKYSDKVNFDIISDKMKFDETLDYTFFTTFIDKFNWYKISRWGNMAEDFIDIFFNELDWSVLCRAQGLTSYLLNKYIDKLIIDDIRYNQYIDSTTKIEIVERLERLERLRLENNEENQENNDEDNQENNEENQRNNDEDNQNQINQINDFMNNIINNTTTIINQEDLDMVD